MPPLAPSPPADFKPVSELREFELPEGNIPFPSGTLTLENNRYAADQVSVTFKKSVSQTVISSLLEGQNIKSLSRYVKAKKHIIKVPLLVDAPLLVRWLRALPEVEDAHLIGILTGGNTPTNRYYNGYAIASQYGLQIIGAEAAWDRTLGLTTQSVAVLDSGINASREDFGYGADKIDSTFGIYPDYLGHGTAVASIIGAETVFNNGLPAPFTMAGVAPNTKILPIKVLSDNDSTTDEIVAAGIRKAITQPQVKVINMSLQTNDVLPETKKAVAEARDKNVLIVGIMGNYPTRFDQYGRPLDGVRQDYVFPGAFWSAMSVSATDASDNRAGFSNQFAPNSVAAPGVNIFAASLNDNSYRGFGFHEYFSGTSSAAPHVAGLAALLTAEYPSMTAFDLKYRMEDTANDVNSATYPGYDYDVGWGRIDAGRATQDDGSSLRTFQPTPSYQLITIPTWPDFLTANESNKYNDVYYLFPNANAQVFWHDLAAGLPSAR